MGWNWVRAFAAAGLAIFGTTSCMIVNLDDDEGHGGGKRICPHACGHASGSRSSIRDPDDGDVDIAPDPVLRPGVVQVFKVIGQTETTIGFASQDMGDPSVAHWVLADDQQYPVNLPQNGVLKLKQLQLANETTTQLCNRAKGAGITNPKIWRVSQAVITATPCPAE